MCLGPVRSLDMSPFFPRDSFNHRVCNDLTSASLTIGQITRLAGSRTSSCVSRRPLERVRGTGCRLRAILCISSVRMEVCQQKLDALCRLPPQCLSLKILSSGSRESPRLVGPSLLRFHNCAVKNRDAACTNNFFSRLRGSWLFGTLRVAGWGWSCPRAQAMFFRAFRDAKGEKSNFKAAWNSLRVSYFAEVGPTGGRVLAAKYETGSCARRLTVFLRF